MVLRSVADLCSVGSEAAGPHTTVARGFPEGPDARRCSRRRAGLLLCRFSITKGSRISCQRHVDGPGRRYRRSSRAALFPPPRDEEWVLDGDAFAFAGMARAAEYVYRESYDALKALHDAGYSIVLTGHSLGAGVASLTAVLLKRSLERIHCVAFAAPACVDGRLAEAMRPFVTSVVLGDDVVPRLTARALRRLVRKLLHERQSCMTHWRADLDAAWGRLRDGLWAPRVRDSLVRAAGAAGLAGAAGARRGAARAGTRRGAAARTRAARGRLRRRPDVDSDDDSEQR